jgi:hypothetical protein
MINTLIYSDDSYKEDIKLLDGKGVRYKLSIYNYPQRKGRKLYVYIKFLDEAYINDGFLYVKCKQEQKKV